MTTVEDINQAVHLGVDAIGLIFYSKSPRYITIDSARELLKTLPPFMSAVGVFVDADNALVEDAIESLPLTHCQFHGGETEEHCAQFNFPYIKAVRVKSQQDIIEASVKYPSAKALLLDTYVRGVKGGTGLAFDWSIIPDNVPQSLILAGGIDCSNIREAMTTSCYAVDVCSGVEESPGTKSKEKMQQLVKQMWSNA